MKWTEAGVGSLLQAGLFEKKVVVVNNCMWTGHEADLLIVEKHGRLIDVEIKVSRSDLKADAGKDKWLDRVAHWTHGQPRPAPTRREWPRRVWKHYYAMPAEIWDDSLLEALPSTKSGVLLLRAVELLRDCVVVRRRAQANRLAKPLEALQILDIARLANLRMWDAYRARETALADVEYWKGLR